jgi:hypothetical protein
MHALILTFKKKSPSSSAGSYYVYALISGREVGTHGVWVQRYGRGLRNIFYQLAG